MITFELPRDFSSVGLIE